MKKNRSIGIVLSYVNTFLNMVCGLFLSAFLLKCLGDTEYGVYQAISSFANYLVLLEFGTGTVMVRNISVCRSENKSPLEVEKNISTIWTITNILSGIILLFSVVFYFSLDTVYAQSFSAEQLVIGKKIFVFIVMYLVLSFYFQTLSSIALAIEHYTFKSTTAIFRTVTRTILLVVIIGGFVKQSIVIAMVDAFLTFFMTVYSYFYCKKNFSIRINFANFDKAIFNASLPLCFAIFLQTIVNQTNSSVAKFIISIKLTPELVSLYSVGLFIYSVFSSLTTIPISMYAPQIVKEVVANKRGKELTDSLVRPSRLIVIIGGTVFFGFIAAGKQFISIVYGEKYLTAWLIAILIMLPMFLNMSNGVIVNVLDAMNKRIFRSLILMVTTLLNILLTLYLTAKYSVIGAAASTCISTLLGQITFMNIYYEKVIGIKVLYMYGKTFKGILVYQILGAAAGFALGRVIDNNYISFMLCGIVYVAIAFGGLVLFGKDETEKAQIKRIISKVRRVK